ncbi:MAG: hypothetical protein L3J37_09325 [Rhodobacteraceae bacterium]|nr:hypothetical protein [Paracoccaceae bacterium]
MVILSYLISAAVGAAMGWFLTQKQPDYGLGSTGNMVVGAVGALVIGYILAMVGPTLGGFIGLLINSVVYSLLGGGIALFALKFVKRP